MKLKTSISDLKIGSFRVEKMAPKSTVLLIAVEILALLRYNFANMLSWVGEHVGKVIAQKSQSLDGPEQNSAFWDHFSNSKIACFQV